MSTTLTTLETVSRIWDESIVPCLVEYVRIPNKSAAFDPQWREHGHMERAVALIEGWCRTQSIPGLSVEVVRLEGRGPLIFMEIPGNGKDTVLLYGHLDKQPEMTGWAEGLGPWKPVIRDDRLYGRGGADDGYAAFASLTALRVLHGEGRPFARCVVLIESGEESGSPDLPAYIDHLRDRIGTPSLIVCLDSGCGDYDRLWCTTSLRGLADVNLTIDILDEGVHSGDASGIVPSTFRIARILLDRLEDSASGRIRLDALHVEIPPQRREQARAVAQVLGSAVHDKFPFVPGAHPMSGDLTELVLNRTWRPTLSVTGMEGMPPLLQAGNVLRPRTSLKLSLRLPPTCNGEAAVAEVKALLEADPPYGARITVEGGSARGWSAPLLADWLGEAIGRASQAHFGQDAVYMGEGGSIPFMAMLGERFPQAQFLITGLLGPGSNAHGPNEFLDIPTGKRLTACVADVVADHARRG